MSDNKVIKLGCAVLAGLSFAAASAAAPATDPWAAVPPSPTSCYWGPDGYTERVEAATDATKRASDRQRATNDELGNKIKSIDPMQLAAKMQEYMMANPQEAAKIMQEAQSAGLEGTNAGVANEEKRKQLEADKDALFTRYHAARDQAVSPVDAKFKSLDARAQKDLVAVGESWAYAPWAVKEYDALVVERNTAYERVCKDWWSPTGQFPGWLGRYREFLVKDQIPPRERMDNAGAGIQVHLIETPTSTFKSTATYDAVVEYLEHARELFKQRETWPTKTYNSGP